MRKGLRLVGSLRKLFSSPLSSGSDGGASQGRAARSREGKIKLYRGARKNKPYILFHRALVIEGEKIIRYSREKPRVQGIELYA